MTASDEAVGAAASAGRPYRGWRIVLALFLCTLALFGVSIYSFIILAQPMGADFGWSPAQTGAAVSAMWFTAPIALLSGPLLRRWKPWTVIYAGLLIQATAFLLLPLIAQIEALYALRIVMGVGKVAMITAVPIVVTTWFSRRFATAMAIIWAGGAAGGFILSPVTATMVEDLGWRLSAVAVGLGLAALVGLIALVARVPAAPSELGLAPDGLALSVGGDRSGPASAESNAGGDWRQDLRAVDWAAAVPMLLSVVGIGMASIAVLTQLQAVLTGVGISSREAATFLGLTAVGSLLGSASIGWLLDRAAAWQSGLLTAVTLYLGLGILALVGPGDPAVWALVAAVSCGYAFGAGEVLWITLTKRQFGTALFATTYGGWYFALQIGYAAGGGVAGLGFERFGALGFFALVALMYAPAALCSLMVRGARVQPDEERS